MKSAMLRNGALPVSAQSRERAPAGKYSIAIFLVKLFSVGRQVQAVVAPLASSKWFSGGGKLTTRCLLHTVFA